MFSIHDLPAVEAWRRRHKLDSYLVRRVRTLFCKKQRPAEVAVGELPAEVRADFLREVRFHALELESRHDSARDGATKLIFRTAGDASSETGGLRLETVVLRIATGRTALCLSTQVGCAARCDFCATGKMAVTRDLSPAEILDQLVQANQLLAAEGRSVRNLVFMGMGEPFHNEDSLYAALDLLADPAVFNLSLRRVLISTVGIPAAMVHCAKRFPDVRMAVSLHSARQEVRERIMPIARRHDLTSLRSAIDEVAAVSGRPVMIEYLLLHELTDRVDDARALVDYLRNLPVHINLIPYNSIAEAPHLAGSDLSRREEFSRLLKTAGYTVTMRYSLGADIAAACGQLAREEHRRGVAKGLAAATVY